MRSEPVTGRLVRLAPGEHPGGIWVAPAYRTRGYEDALPDVWLRPKLVERLRSAGATTLRAGHGLLVWDGWRPASLQRALYEEYTAELARTSGLSGAQLRRHVAGFVTDPDRVAPVPAHGTGGAVDLTLCDPRTGAPRDMGGGFDELTARTVPSYYDGGDGPAAREHAELRRLLDDAMTQAGFVRLHSEWWHFEYGTDLWARERGEPVSFDATPGPG